MQRHLRVDTQSPGPDYTLEVYHWQAGTLPGTDLPGRWVALATTAQNGKAVAFNAHSSESWRSRLSKAVGGQPGSSSREEIQTLFP